MHPRRSVGESFLIEMQLDHATLSFLWRFDGLSERRTKVTQRIELSGSNAGAYARQAQAGFGSNLFGWHAASCGGDGGGRKDCTQCRLTAAAADDRRGGQRADSGRP